MWRGVGVNMVVESEIEDDNEDDYCELLFNAAVNLGGLIEKLDY